MRPRDRANDVQAQPGAFDFQTSRLNTIKPSENPFQLLAWYADPAILDADPDGIRRWRRHGHRHAHRLVRVLHRVVEKIRDDRPKFLDVAPHDQIGCVVRLHDDGALLKVVARLRQLDGLAHESGDVNRRSCNDLRLVADRARLQYLVYRAVQPFRIRQHDIVETTPLLLAERSRLKGFEVQAYRRDRRLELVRHGVDEGVVLLVAANLENEKHGVDDQPGDDQPKRDDAEDEDTYAGPLGCDDNPADVQGDRCRYEEDAESDEKGDRLLAPGHPVILRNSLVADHQTFVLFVWDGLGDFRHFHVPRQAEQPKGADADPVQIQLIPGEAVSR